MLKPCLRAAGLRRLADDSDRRAADLHHQANLIMPLPVIGSVLLDGGQALRIPPGRRKVSRMSKKILRRCNKMPLGGVMAAVCTRRWHGSACHAGSPVVLILCCRSHGIEESGFDISDPGRILAPAARQKD